MERKIKPTIREVRVVLDALNASIKHLGHYNDQRKDGGRIKLCQMVKPSAMVKLQKMLQDLFPSTEMKVYNHNWNDLIVTCIKWKYKT